MSLDAETLAQLRDTVSRFVRERLIPLEAQVAEDDRIPDATVQEIRELGLFGMSIPEEYGGLGLSMSEEATIAFELGFASPAFRSLIGTNNGIGSQGIIMDGTPEQKERYLPQLATGDLIASFALTEPDVGSDAGSVRTTARRDSDHYVLNGVKRFITNAPRAGLFTVFARTDPNTRDAAGVSAFLVEASNPGLKLGPKDRKMGQRGAHTCDVIFEDCRVPASALLGGKENVGFKTAMKVLDRGRLHTAAPVTCKNMQSSASIGMCGCFASTKARLRSSRSSSAEIWCAMCAWSADESYACRHQERCPSSRDAGRRNRRNLCAHEGRRPRRLPAARRAS